MRRQNEIKKTFSSFSSPHRQASSACLIILQAKKIRVEKKSFSVVEKISFLLNNEGWKINELLRGALGILGYKIQRFGFV